LFLDRLPTRLESRPILRKQAADTGHKINQSDGFQSISTGARDRSELTVERLTMVEVRDWFWLRERHQP
ncbi:hypothetical protein ACEQ6C_40225, partial [Rhizobium ruizarguesonis]